MLPITPPALKALTEAHTVHVSAEWSNDGGATWTLANLAEGSVSADRSAENRYSASAVLVDVPVGRQGVNTVSTLVRLYRGVGGIRRAVEWFPAGVYAVTKATMAAPDRVAVELAGLEGLLRAAVFPTTRVVGPGRAVDLVDVLVHEAVPGAPILWDPELDETTAVPRMVSEESRWELLSEGTDESGASIGIARALGAEAFFDARGAFTVRRTPSIYDPYVWAIGRGAGGVLVNRSLDQNSDALYNVVAATGDKGDGSPVVGPAYAWDDDPASITYAGPSPVYDPLWPNRNNRRDIRVRVKRYSSPLLTSQVQAEKAAASVLADSLGTQSTLSFQAVCNPALEPGDVVRVEVDPGVWQLHLVDSVRWDLTGASMDCATRTTTRRF